MAPERLHLYRGAGRPAAGDAHLTLAPTLHLTSDASPGTSPESGDLTPDTLPQVLTCCLLPPTSPLHHLLPAPEEGGAAPEEGGAAPEEGGAAPEEGVGHLLVVAGEGGGIAAIDLGNRQKVG